MKRILFIPLVVLASFLFPFIGLSETLTPAVCFNVTYTPENPVVGDLVTFSVSSGCVGTATSPVVKNDPQQAVAYMSCWDPDGDAATTVIFPEGEPGIEVRTSSMVGGPMLTQLPTPATFTHIYSAPGAYNIDFACANNGTFPRVVIKQNTFAKARAGTVTLGQITIGAAVPTLGQWGLVILGLFLAIFGIITIRQRATV